MLAASASSASASLSALCVAPATFESRFIEDRTPLSLPANESCPALLSRYSAYVKTDAARQIECCTSEPQRELLARLKFRSCDGATVGVRHMLEAVRGRTLAFVGDSVQHQFYHALVFDLAQASIPFSTKIRGEWSRRVFVKIWDFGNCFVNPPQLQDLARWLAASRMKEWQQLVMRWRKLKRGDKAKANTTTA
jgi:hypothetical protein